MATSSTSICNGALIRIGCARIAALTDDSDEARACNELYEQCRDALFRAHDWNFGIARAVLTQADTQPLSGFDYQYYLPADCLYIEDTNILGDEQTSWRIEQSVDGRRVLLTDETSVIIRYVTRALDFSQYDALFVDALIAKLAAELAIPLTGKQSLTATMYQIYESKLLLATSRNAKETGTVYAHANTTLTRVRVLPRARIPGITQET